jgi:hypothetical protein
MNSSPGRNTFQRDAYLQRKAEEGKTPENDVTVRAMADYYASWNEEKLKQEADPEWQEENLEYDLRSTKWICDKAKDSEKYAQNLYAAMCNTDFQKNEMMPILKGQTWGCSWRYAGGIIADMREEGDYIDWYCSGIRGDGDSNLPPDGFVGEGYITDEIRKDLKKLGWNEVEISDDDAF